MTRKEAVSYLAKEFGVNAALAEKHAKKVLDELEYLHSLCVYLATENGQLRYREALDRLKELGD